MSLSEKDPLDHNWTLIEQAAADALGWKPAVVDDVSAGLCSDYMGSQWSLARKASMFGFQAAREEAYKEGWNDREGDLIAGVNRIAPEEASQGAGEPVAGKAGGFAPGSYECRCLTCGNAFEGDKRAISCRPCAEKALPAERLYEAFRREMKPSWPAWKDQSHAVALAFHRIVSASPPPANDRTKALEEALKPFAAFAENVNQDGWTSNIHREGISVWFGPSDFRAARAALSPVQAVKGDDHG